jgi:hypothetical protein
MHYFLFIKQPTDIQISRLRHNANKVQTAFQAQGIDFFFLMHSVLLMFLQKADIIASLQHTAASQSILTQSMSPICKGKGKS